VHLDDDVAGEAIGDDDVGDPAARDAAEQRLGQRLP
jgi:hypothetical protein